MSCSRSCTDEQPQTMTDLAIPSQEIVQVMQSTATLMDSTMEEMKPLTVWAKRWRTLALCAAYLSLGLCMSVTGPTLPYLQWQVNVTVAEIAYIFTSRSLGVLTGSFVGGLILDRFNRYVLFCLVTLAVALGVGAMPWCRHLWLLTVTTFLMGIAGGFYDTGASVVCFELWAHRSGPYLQAMHSTFAVGGTISPLFVQSYLQIPDCSHRDPYSGSPSIAVLNPDTNHSIDATHSINTAQSAELTNRSCRYSQEQLTESCVVPCMLNMTGPYPSDIHFQMVTLYTVIAGIIFVVALSFTLFVRSKMASPKMAVTEQSQSHSSTVTVAFIVLMGCLFIFYLVSVGAEIAFSQYLTTFAAIGPSKSSPSTATLVTTLFWACFAVTRLLSIFIARLASPALMIMFNLTCCLGSSVVLCFMDQNQDLLLIVSSCLMGIGLASTFATGFLWTETHLQVTSRIASSFSVASAAGEMILPTVTGILIANHSLSFAYVMLTVHLLAAVAFSAAWLVARRYRYSRYTQ